MVDPIRRKLLKAGAAAAAVAATPSVLAQQGGNTEGGRFYQKGNVRIHYEETGSGFPLLLIAGGGLNGSTIGAIRGGNPFNTIDALKGEFRLIYADLRNAEGQSTGPLEVNRPWDSYTDDHIGLMDHLGIDKFMVLGFCIAGPFIWNLMKRAPNRVVAAVPAQPVGFRPELPTSLYDSQKTGWAEPLVKRRPEITMAMADQFLTRMFRNNPDFVFTVTRDFVKTCQTPVLVLPDDTAGHSYAAAVESAMLAPKGQLSMYPWKDTPAKIPLAVRHVRSFLLSHRTT
ncbi:MAG TPA: alpha/beta hydrolase [Vicinamibacterales bacterium]|jgi:pimeloyl-ACP methyl ester carboxylesterase|nr:alpha/beta hydrolase [Vicinamibacterales bacterium]